MHFVQRVLCFGKKPGQSKPLSYKTLIESEQNA